MSGSYEKLVRFQNWRREGQGGGPRRPPPSQPGLPLKSEMLARHAPGTTVLGPPRSRLSVCSLPDSRSPVTPLCTSGATGQRRGVGAGRPEGARLTGAGGRGKPREGPGDAGSWSGALQSDPTSPHPRAPAEGGPRGPPPASPTQTRASGVNAEGRRAPSPHPSPKRNQHCHNNKNLGNSSPDDERGCPPTRTPQQQPCFPKLVRDTASWAAAPSPVPRALPSLPVRKKASTSESAAPPSSAAPSGGFMTGGGRPRAAGGWRSLGPRAARRPVGGGRGAQRPRPQTRRTPGFEGGRPGRRGWGRGRRGSLKRRRAAGWGRLLPAPPWSPFPGGAGRLRSGPSRGPGCLDARSPPAAAAGSPPRPSACLYCSALLGSPLYFSSSLPPSLSLYLLPPSLARPLARSPSLARSLAPPLAPSAAAAAAA